MSRSPTSWRVRSAGAFGGIALTALLRTLNVRAHVDPALTQYRETGKNVVYAFWHGRMLPLVHLHRDEGIVVLVSEHRDGEVIARIVGSLGFATARGSSTRGGSKAIRQLLRFAAKGHDTAITPDGPRGPREVAQPGVVAAARLTGCPVVPVATAADRHWALRSWDRFSIPKPFSTLHVRYGAPLHVGDDSSEEEALRRVQEALDEVTERVDADAGLHMVRAAARIRDER